MEATAVRFAVAARVLAGAARRHGLVVPAFRSPPRLADADRTLRRAPGGSPVVAVRLRDRLWTAVLADMIEGVVAAGGLAGARADDARAVLWSAAQTAELVSGPVSVPADVVPASRGQAGRVARRPSLRAVPGGAPHRRHHAA